MKPTRTTVPDDVYAALCSIAKQRGTSLAAVARTALTDYVDGDFRYRLNEISASQETTTPDSISKRTYCQVERERK